ncbi:MAG: hypothetical protein IPP55_17015 [Anaerolineales bacterium]|nr:hypothetical protein [Anaerolineales bacterium]
MVGPLRWVFTVSVLARLYTAPGIPRRYPSHHRRRFQCCSPIWRRCPLASIWVQFLIIHDVHAERHYV